MYNNIGSKIKTLAKVLFWIEIAFTIIGGTVMLALGIANGGDAALYGVLAFFVIIIFGILGAWLSNFLLYGFGELIDSNTKILRILETK